MFTKSFASAAVLALLLPATQAIGASHEGMKDRVDATNTLPDAKPGECYAKVIVPAKYEVKAEKVMIKPETEKVEIKPAAFDVSEKTVVAKEGYTKIKAVPAKFREEVEEVEISPSRTVWVTSLGKKGIPASPALLAAAKTNGIAIEDAKVGQCFKEYFIPAKFEQIEKEVLVKEESEEIKIAPAQFEEAEEKVVVKQASKKKVYKPAEYETIEEKIEIEPAKAVWKKGDGPITRIDNSTGEIMCLVQVPAKYQTIKKTVLKSEPAVDIVEVPEETKAVKVSKLVSDAVIDKVKIPAKYKKVTIKKKVSDAKFVWRPAGVDGEGTYTGNQICLKEVPAKYAKVKKLVLDTAATVEEEKVPPVTKVVKVKKVVSEAEEIRKKIPAVYKTVEKRAKVSNERLEWRRVLCKTNMGPGINKRIQQALKDAGVYNGAVDGNIGRGTMKAVEAFQKKNGLPTGGLTIDVLEKLGVK